MKGNLILRKRLMLACWLLIINFSSLHAQVYDVTRFGAIGDSITDNTLFIQKAIDSCAETGGKVYFPRGIFLTATLYLKSHVTLDLSGGAVILGIADFKKYPYLNAGIHFYGEDWAKQSLIFCKDQEDVSIEGNGIIDGQGAKFITATIKKPDRYKNRPYLLWFINCKNISVKGIQLRNSAFWMQHYLGCEYVNINGIKIWNHSNKNNDMMDIDGCKYVTISNVIGDSDDDGITIKSTSPLLSEHITITNCVLSSHCNALKFGTESTGGFRNITVSNCIIKPSAQLSTIYGKPAGNSGISLELVDGGIMENVTVDNIVIEGPQVPLFIRLGNRARKYIDAAKVPLPGKIRNINISNIIATSADETGCSFTGIEKAAIENISLSNISIETSGSDEPVDLSKPVEEKESEYPEAAMFGKLPSYGFFIRYARDIKLSNITIRSKNKEVRPGIIVDKTDRFLLTGLDIQSVSDTKAAVYINSSSNGVIKNNLHHYPVQQFLLKGQLSANIETDSIKK
ncbi:glycoside hydrolase family 28 protein [Parafilimonas sp.]|uniref:glycoside hydrolase family 28 protein n=1 Tax=Parafilimonas sp. TaxID=1969739 RepID=UPI0039E2B7D9